MSFKSKVYETIHKQPYGTEELIDIKDMIIPYCFSLKQSKPKGWKMQKVRDYYNIHNRIDKPITVELIMNEKGMTNRFLVIDEYTRYLILKENNIRKVPIKYAKAIKQ